MIHKIPYMVEMGILWIIMGIRKMYIVEIYGFVWKSILRKHEKTGKSIGSSFSRFNGRSSALFSDGNPKPTSLAGAPARAGQLLADGHV